MTTPLLANADACRIPLADESVDVCVTSPPYWRLRDYGVVGQLGMEASPDEFVASLVEVFREVRRVLKPSGTVWCNIGDGYASQPQSDRHADPKAPRRTPDNRCRTGNLKPKDLCLIPARLSIALQEDGWWIRSQIIWHKPNPMPESVTDRPAISHEYILLLTKSARYFYDATAVREGNQIFHRKASGYKNHHIQNPGEYKPFRGKGGFADCDITTVGRNRRTVWTIPTQSFRGAHFATFPVALPDICIRAGSSEHGCCAECGSPWKRMTDKSRTFESGSGKAGNMPDGKHGPGLQGGGETLDVRRGPVVHVTTVGWEPTCTCSTPEVVPATILDPFVGSGSTLIAARRLGRQGIGLDLSFPYLRDQARPRLELDRLADWGQGREVAGELDGLPLFEMRGEE